MNQAQYKIIEQPHSNLKKNIFQISVSILVILFLLLYLPISAILTSVKQISLLEWSLYLFMGFFIGAFIIWTIGLLSDQISKFGLASKQK